MGFDRKYLVWALCYAAVGMGLGVYMGASENHGQLVTHGHILLVGFVVSLIYGVIHKLWLGEIASPLAKPQFIVHQVGTIVLVSGLFLLYGSFLPAAKIGPVLGISSIVVLAGVLMMLAMVVKSNTGKS